MAMSQNTYTFPERISKVRTAVDWKVEEKDSPSTPEIQPGGWSPLFKIIERNGGKLLVYSLLIGGSLIFIWPFLWMAATSVKLDREMFGPKLRLWPQRPVPAEVSPYIDERFFQDVEGKRLDEVLPLIERHLSNRPDLGWPDDTDRSSAIPQVARGIFAKLQSLLPVETWSRDLSELGRSCEEKIDQRMVDQVLGQVRRHLAIGALHARSYDLTEDELVSGSGVANAWQLSGPGELRQTSEQGKNFADLSYDFTGEKRNRITLSQTFRTSFPVDRLHKLQLYLRPDDSWHGLSVTIEKLGRKYQAIHPGYLSDFNWTCLTWQEPGPDDALNKIRSWVLLKEIALPQGTAVLNDPGAIKVTLELTRNTFLGAWGAKILRNYRSTLNHIPFWRYLGTSVFLVILNIVLTLFSCSLVAYSFARLQWPGRNLSFALMLATMMIPGQVTMIPHFLIIRWLGWYNTLYPLWVPSLFAGAFNVFLLRQFLKGIPRDLEDAAKIDGCGYWRVYWHVMLPLVRPTLAAIAIFTFMGTWNDFMGPLIYLNDQRLYPLSLGLFALNVQTGGGAGSMGIMMAGSLLMTLPVIAIFFFAQRYFLQGVTFTGMKG